MLRFCLPSKLIATALFITVSATPVLADYLTVSSITPLPIPSGLSSLVPLGINDSGDVVGGSGAGSAFLYTPAGGTTNLGALLGGVSSAVGINEAGQVLIDYTPGPFLPDQAYVYSGGSLTNIGAFTPVAINNSGQVAGYGTIGANTGVFLYSGGNVTYIAALGSGADVRGMNDAGQIVGYDSNGRFGFLYSNGQVTRLSFTPQGIDDAGAVLGYGGVLYSNGRLITLPGNTPFGITSSGLIGGITCCDLAGQDKMFIYNHGSLSYVDSLQDCRFPDVGCNYQLGEDAGYLNNHGQLADYEGSATIWNIDLPESAVPEPASLAPLWRWRNTSWLSPETLVSRLNDDSSMRLLSTGSLQTGGTNLVMRVSINDSGQVAGSS